MSSPVSLQVLYKIANAPIREFPFAHIYVQDVFPSDFYRQIRANLPPKSAYSVLAESGRVSKEYPDTRYVLKLPENLAGVDVPQRQFWSEIGNWLLGGSFGRTMLLKFAPYLEPRLGDLSRCGFYDEALLVQDYTTYFLGPHTDAPQKVLSFLFYLPADESLSHWVHPFTCLRIRAFRTTAPAILLTKTFCGPLICRFCPTPCLPLPNHRYRSTALSRLRKKAFAATFCFMTSRSIIRLNWPSLRRRRPLSAPMQNSPFSQ